MARRIVDEKMRFTIIVNEGRKELYDLEVSTRSLTFQNKGLRAELIG